MFDSANILIFVSSCAELHFDFNYQLGNFGKNLLKLLNEKCNDAEPSATAIAITSFKWRHNAKAM